MKRLLPLIAVLCLCAAAAVTVVTGREADSKTCPPGFRLVTLGTDPDGGTDAGEDADRAEAPAGRTEQAGRVGCLNAKHPETYADYSQVAQRGQAHDATTTHGLRYGAHAAAVRQARQIAHKSSGVAGSGGSWAPVGNGPLIANDPTYPRTSGEGFANLAGRITSFALDSSHNVVYVSVGQGGVWKSSDLGGTWTSIGDKLPSQPVGSVAYTTAGGGTLIAVTGNDTFGGGTGSYGMGVYYTRDEGSSWHKSAGVPDDALGFRARVDPNNPSIVYAATGAGLYRSTDAGATFANVNLPTGFTDGDPTKAPLSPNCTGQFRTPKCFLANMVTDVVVQGPANGATAGGKPGAVMAAVGWRAGNKNNPNGSYVESPNNGIYVSDTGAPGTFKRIDTSGATSLGDQSQVGRTELGIASGADQNHRVVYAEVQDAQAFKNSEAFGIDAPTSLPTGSNTYLRGIYVSTDFGATWRQLTNASALDGDPSTGSSLTGVGCQAQNYCPGVQAWYNQWIQPDPTMTGSGGVPSRLMFGLEEVWENDPSTPNLDGTTPAKFKVVGRYFGGTSCQFLDLGIPYCPTNGSDQSPTTLHPDQHAGMFVPDGNGGVTVFAGNDGGVFKQHVDKGADFTSGGWGAGQQNGFHTLMPYDVAIANDGTVVGGLQDNGEAKVSPDGKQNEVFDGDGFYSAIEPANSKVIYEEYTYGTMNVSTDGGSNWTEIHAADTLAQFAMPFTMDPTDPKHLIAGGGTDPNNPNSNSFVEETTNGPDTTEPAQGPAADTDWVNVFDIGTTGDYSNSITATDTRGDASYVGFCGACQVLTQTPFANGIATNVGGDKPGKKASTDGWHRAKAEGLPQRMITGIAIDPSDAKTVYVTLADYSRRWTPAGVLGEDVSKIGKGHVFVSHDAGGHFSDISGNLPDAPANDVVLHGSQLAVATDVGVFISSDTSSPTWAAAGSGLPSGVQVLALAVKSDDPGTMVAATHGRGFYKYRFADPTDTPGGTPGGAANPAKCRILVPRKAAVSRSKRSGQRVKVRVRCGQSVKLRLSGAVRATFPKRNGKRPKAQTFRLKARSKALKAKRTLTVRVVLPKKAIRALRRHAKETITFRVVATNAKGRSTVSAKVRSVKLRK